MSTVAGPAQPASLAPRFAAFPDEITRLDQWVLWRRVRRYDRSTKEPFAIHGQHASSTDPNTWARFEDVVTVYEAGGFDGVGFVLSEDDPFVGIDLDDVIADDGMIHPEALRIVREINSYAERSPSRRGLRIIARGTLPPGWRNTKRYIVNIEMYDSDRFLTITGHRVEVPR